MWPCRIALTAIALPLTLALPAIAEDERESPPTYYELLVLHSGHGASQEPIAGDLFLASRLVGGLEDKLTGWTYQPAGRSYSVSRLGLRILRMSAIDLPFGQWLTAIQHEYAGHRGRALEAGGKVLDVNIGSPWGGSPATWVDGTGLTENEVLAVHGGGIEANNLLAQSALREMLVRRQARWSDLPAYLVNKITGSGYVWATPHPGDAEWETESGNDVRAYIEQFGALSSRSSTSLRGDVGRGAIWSAVDPGLVAGLYAYFVGHVALGKQDVKLPMLRVGSVELLPGTDFNLSPVGPEYYLRLHMRTSHSLWSFYGRNARGHAQGPGYGIGVRRSAIACTRSLCLDAGFDLWRQPDMAITEAPAVAAEKQLVGVNVEARGALDLGTGDRHRLAAVATAGLKTKGYVAGRPLAAGPYGWFGLRLGL